MLKKNDWLIIKSYIGPLLATFFVCLFLLLMQFLWRYIDDLVGKGLEWGVIAELLLYASAQLVPMALPLAILLAGIMTFGNMGEHNELMAMKAAGIALPRVMFPLIIINLFIGISAFFFSNYLLPYTNLKMGALLYDIRQQRPELNIREGVFYDGISGIDLKISSKDYKTNTLYGIMIYDHRGHSGNLNVTVADSGYIVMSQNKQYLIFTVFNGETYEDIRDRKMFDSPHKNYPFKRQKFAEQKVLIELAGYDFTRTNSDLFKNNYQMLNLYQLDESIDSLRTEYVRKQITHINRLLSNSYCSSIGRNDGSVNVYFNTDSAYASFDSKKQIITLDYALDYARATKRRINNMELSFFDKKEWISKHQIEWHKKFTLSIACLILFFVGAPFGAIVRKGGLGMPILISILFFLFYYIITMIGEKSVKAGDMIPVYGSWLPSGLLLIIGVYLTTRAAKDAVIIDISRYFYFITKHFTKKRTIYKRFGNRGVYANEPEFYTQKLNEISDELGQYASELEKSNFSTLYTCGMLKYPNHILYYRLQKKFMDTLSEYIYSPDVEHLFIKEQLLVIPKLKNRFGKTSHILNWALLIVTLGLSGLIIGFFRLRLFKKRVVKSRSHILSILNFKEKRGLR